MGNNVIGDAVPTWVDEKTRDLIDDTIVVLCERHGDLLAIILYGSVARHQERPLTDSAPSDVDLLALFVTALNPMRLPFSLAVSQSLVIALARHPDAPRDVNVMLASESLQEWDATYLANVARDGVILYAKGPLPSLFRQLQVADEKASPLPQIR